MYCVQVQADALDVHKSCGLRRNIFSWHPEIRSDSGMSNNLYRFVVIADNGLGTGPPSLPLYTKYYDGKCMSKIYPAKTIKFPFS